MKWSRNWFSGACATRILVAVVTGAACTLAHAELELAFFWGDVNHCPTCSAQLQLVTAVGPRSVTSFARGIMKSTGVGVGDPGQPYYVGACSPPDCVPRLEFRNWFAFDVTLLPDITGATLLITMPNPTPPLFGVYWPNGSRNYVLHRVEPYTEDGLVAGGLLSHFEALGTGVPLGSVQVSRADQGNVVTIPLNTDAIAYLNSARGYYDTPPHPWATAVLGGALVFPAIPVPTLSWPLMLVLAGICLAVGSAAIRSWRMRAGVWATANRWPLAGLWSRVGELVTRAASP